MRDYADVMLSEDGVLCGDWGEYSSSLILCDLRKAVPGDQLGDIFVLACLAYDVLVEQPVYKSTSIFSGERQNSLFIAMMKNACSTDWNAISAASEDDIIKAVNIARWLLRLPQQTSTSIVFVGDGRGDVPSPRRRAGAVAVAS